MATRVRRVRRAAKRITSGARVTKQGRSRRPEYRVDRRVTAKRVIRRAVGGAGRLAEKGVFGRSGALKRRLRRQRKSLAR